MRKVARIKDSPILLVDSGKNEYRYLLDSISGVFDIDSSDGKDELIVLLTSIKKYIELELERISKEGHELEFVI